MSVRLLMLKIPQYMQAPPAEPPHPHPKKTI